MKKLLPIFHGILLVGGFISICSAAAYLPNFPQPQHQPQVNYMDPFIPMVLDIGGDQHYTAANRRYFTNIVAVETGDLDGDGILDIVMLANAVPQNGAYGTNFPLPPASYRINHFSHSQAYGMGTNANGTPKNFLNSGDFLFGSATTLSTLLGAPYNPLTSVVTWFDTTIGTNVPPATYMLFNVDTRRIAHYAPDSPNVVAGEISTPPYVGSDIAWLKGDGRGYFELRFITPLDPLGNPAPARIRLAKGLRLAKISRSGLPGMDIVVWTGNDLMTNAYYPQDSTSIEPFTGTCRLFWLENRGWNGPRLDFVDREIAEYNYDRMPVIFYGAHQNMSGGWAGPYVSFNPTNVFVDDINGDGFQDVLALNGGNTNSTSGYGASNVKYNGTNPPSAFFSNYSPVLPRPNINDRWVWNAELWSNPPNSTLNSPRAMFWYENTASAGPNILSTSTYHVANINGAPFTISWPGYKDFARANFTQGREGYFILDSSTGPIVMMRNGNPNVLNLQQAQSSIPNLPNTEYGYFRAADMDGDGNDDIIARTFECNNGCYHRLHVFTVIPNGNQVTYTDTLVYTASGNFPMLDAFDIADYNRDNLPDIMIASAGSGNNSPMAGVLLINKSTVGNPSFVSLNQRNPYTPNGSFPENKFSQVVEYDSMAPLIRLATGDFNGDNFNDVVRVGPSSPVTIFFNNVEGLQRTRITTGVLHRTGAQKVWTSVWGGTINAGGAVQPNVGNTNTNSDAGAIGARTALTQ